MFVVCEYVILCTIITVLLHTCTHIMYIPAYKVSLLCILIAWCQVFPLIFLTVYTSQMHPKPLQCTYLIHTLICCTATRWGLWLKHLAPGYKPIITPHYLALAVYLHSMGCYVYIYTLYLLYHDVYNIYRQSHNFLVS